MENKKVREGCPTDFWVMVSADKEYRMMEKQQT